MRSIDIEQLEESINDKLKALVHLPADYDDRLATAKSVLVENLEDFEEAINCINEALVLRPPEQPDRSLYLHSFAIAISTRFDLLGRLQDLETSITYRRDALLCAPDHTFRFGLLIWSGIGHLHTLSAPV